ncbi:hypothetical protein M5D96_007340 [Drosophila gunungcola]|uniref:Uncharacterized protein n=1 Tax=Drosophila gunungcola TaxID=103775 RepID=A0A9P9YNE2_9MUSC|nr:hypothetical protein M5D96_007340 [Drosophila gunungcola]
MGSMAIVAQVHGTLRRVDLLELKVLGFVLVPAHRAITTDFIISADFRWPGGERKFDQINQKNQIKTKSKNKLIGNRIRLITLVEPVQADRWRRRGRRSAPGRRASGAEKKRSRISVLLGFRD